MDTTQKVGASILESWDIFWSMIGFRYVYEGNCPFPLLGLGSKDWSLKWLWDSWYYSKTAFKWDIRLLLSKKFWEVFAIARKKEINKTEAFRCMIDLRRKVYLKLA